jgi:hypothetical protein
VAAPRCARRPVAGYFFLAKRRRKDDGTVVIGFCFMPPNVLLEQLERIGKRLNRWSAQLNLMLWCAAILFGLVAFAFSDILAQYERVGRVATWLLLVALVAVAVWQLARALSRPQSPEAVAVQVEQAFPQLDNHLINCLQFSRDAADDPFKAAYVRMALPHWDELDFGALKDSQSWRQAMLVLAAAVVLLLVPFPLVGRAWPVAMWRVVNPFSDVEPVTLTRILNVAPGESSVVQGGSVLLTCAVRGQAGHEVYVDVQPADAKRKTFCLGKITGAPEEIFSNRISQVTVATRYRFRAGDSPSPRWYNLSVRPPLAFTSVDVRVVPPPHTGGRAKNFDAQSAGIEVPAGATVELSVNCNAPCESLSVAGKDGAAQPLQKKSDAQSWAGSIVVSNGAALKVAAVAVDGGKAESVLPFTLIPDRPPTIEIVSPKGDVTLPPGSAPTIHFSVADDYGLDEITIERVSDPNAKDAAVEVLKTYKWVTSRSREFSALWRGAIRKPSEKDQMMLRVVAKDNCPGAPHAVTSRPILFNMLPVEQAAEQRKELEKKVFSDLNKIIELQRENIARTKQCQENLPVATAEQWTDLGGRQKQIRETTKVLLDKGAACLGNLSGAVKRLYVQEMVEAVSLLDRLPTARAEEKSGLTKQSLVVEEKILRQLTFANMAMTRAQIDSRTSELVGMLDGLIKEQNRIWRVTTQCVANAKAPVTLVRAQEAEASDTYEFTKACQAEAAAVIGSDKAFGGFLAQIATMSRDLKIREDMLLAAEQLEKSGFTDAAARQQSALAKLRDVRRRFDELQATQDKEKNQEMIEALQNANKKLEKIKALEKKLIEAMDAVREMKDKDKKKSDEMEEDFKEMAKNAEAAMLQVPKDLEIFADLNVGNDLVEDIASTFEEIRQEAGSELPTAGPVKELAVAKREAMLDGMEKVQERMDEMEYWLKKSPDGLKINTEAFDREEMPNGIALAPLLTKVNDLIGDLMNETKEKQEQDQDGAINSATPDMTPDGPVTEGDVTSFAAQGKTGNETPDHKEQDGRSNVGRQGMSDGETAAGSGTISKGDDNIEARRTQDPTQSGQVNADGEAQTKATGGGKLGTGKGDEYGQGGGTRRMDSKEAGSLEAMTALMAKQADATYAQASLKGVKTDSLKAAAHHMRQVADAIARGAPIEQVAELKRKALAELRAGKTELEQGNADMLDTHVTSSLLKDVQQAGPEEAPPKYRPLVSEYFKKLNESF